MCIPQKGIEGSNPSLSAEKPRRSPGFLFLRSARTTPVVVQGLELKMEIACTERAGRVFLQAPPQWVHEIIPHSPQKNPGESLGFCFYFGSEGPLPVRLSFTKPARNRAKGSMFCSTLACSSAAIYVVRFSIGTIVQG